MAGTALTSFGAESFAHEDEILTCTGGVFAENSEIDCAGHSNYQLSYQLHWKPFNTARKLPFGGSFAPLMPH